MRFTGVFLLLVGCSSTETTVVPDVDASVADADVEPDAEPVVDAGPGFTYCAEAGTADTCFMTGACAGGHAYRCMAAEGCPIGDVGGCRQLATDPAARTSDLCCERAACTRATGPLTAQCREELDAGSLQGWSCPVANGKQLAKPPGTCTLRGQSATVAEHCCR